MRKLEVMYAVSLDEACKLYRERKRIYADKGMDVQVEIIETRLTIPWRVEIWGELK